MKETLTVILNRNLGLVTNRLVEKIFKYNKDYTDIYVLDAGSKQNKMSKYTNYSVRTKSAKKNGLRFNRGMNYALSKLYLENNLKKYKYFFLITNDTVVEAKNFIKKMFKIMEDNKKIGILSPCSKKWGEQKLLKKNKLKYFWYIHNNAYFLRKELILKLMSLKKPYHINFFFDGKNFRGYGSESEIFLKSYKKDLAAAITSDVWIEENENYLIKHSNLINTENFDKNLKLYISEGKQWLKKKYGTENLWDLNLMVKKEYDKFFKRNKKLKMFKI